jgi:hypothetical protein
MRVRSIVVGSLCASVTAGCGAGARTATVASVPIPHVAASTACTRAARAELVAVARRIADQASRGRNAVAATRRIERARPLAIAVAAGDRAATAAALRPLLKHQITRIEISAPGRGVLARDGTTPAYGPVRGTLRVGGLPVGRYVLSVSRQRDFTSLVRELTGATATFRARPAPDAQASLPATAFPRGRRTIALALPRVASTVCGPSAADTRAATAGLVARHLLDAEQRGAGAHRAVRHAEKDRAFTRAVRAGDPVAVRAAIVSFFKDKRFHIVRARVWNGARLISDVGGPHVLSPATGAVGASRFMLSIQDDTGYIKLLHRFTGADVTLSTAAGGVVPGSNVTGGPPFAPGLRVVRYHRRTWRSFGLVGTAFPAGPLRVSLLLG